MRSYLGCVGLVAAASLAVAAAPARVHAQPDYGSGQGYYDRGYGDQGYDDQGYRDQSGDYPHETSGVTVYAPRTVGRSATTGAPIELVRASRVVDYSDIDPDTDWGANVLRTRIERAARSACDELDAEYPISSPDNPPCVDEAVRNAMYQVRDNAEASGW